MSAAQIGILWPTLAFVALVFAVLFTLAVKRFALMRNRPPRRDDMATAAAYERYFEPVERPARNLANLFEMPVLFLALVPLLLVTRQASQPQILLAWIFVLLRAGHSIVHISGAKVRLRFLLFLLSCIVLAAMWIGFAVDLAGMASTLAAVR